MLGMTPARVPTVPVIVSFGRVMMVTAAETHAENTKIIKKSKIDINCETYPWGERCSSSSTRSSRAESVLESAFTGGV